MKGSVSGSLCYCFIRPELLGYPVPPVPAQVPSSCDRSHDGVSRNAQPSPPVEHEYHCIDVNYKRVTYADHIEASVCPPTEYQYVVFSC